MKSSYKGLIAACLLSSAFILFCGFDGCERISGRITCDAQSRVTITLSGNANDMTFTTMNGQYSFTSLGYGSYTITPSLSGYVFSPSSQSVTVPGDNTQNVNFIADSRKVWEYETGDEVWSSPAVLDGMLMLEVMMERFTV